MMKKETYLVAGLGNPGREYAKTRHNIGFMVLEKLSDRFSIPLSKKKFDTVFGRGTIGGVDVVLAMPVSYMNRSGPPLQKLANFFSIPRENILVVHDDIDLAFARLKIRGEGGHGGHNGIRSIIGAFGNGEFMRLRVGVGRPAGGTEVTGHVLGKFSRGESGELEELVDRSADAAETIVVDGIVKGMNRFN